MKTKFLDLTKQFPRSPKEAFGGFVHLGRMMDKARAKAAGTQGEYIYPCPLDNLLLDFLKIKAEDFYHVARDRKDQKILEWIRKNAKLKSPEEIEEWNRTFLNRKPDNPESMNRFLKIRNQIAPDRTDIQFWTDLLDLDEDRSVPRRSLG